MTVFVDITVDSSTVSQNYVRGKKIQYNFHERLLNYGSVLKQETSHYQA